MVSGAVSVDSSEAEVQGNNGGLGYSSAGVTETMGGNAWVSLGSLTMTSNNYAASAIGTQSDFQVAGGTGSSDSAGGIGGKGGNASLATGTLSLNDATLQVYSGTGGSGGGLGNGASTDGAFSDESYSGGTGSGSVTSGAGGQGGNTSLDAASISLVNPSTLEVYGNTGGYGGGSGNGGNSIDSQGL